METTKLSSKGQVILPAAIRTANQWKAGVEFAVEDTGDGVMLRPLKPFAATTISEVAGCADYHGKVHTLEEMDKAITAETRVRNARR